MKESHEKVKEGKGNQKKTQESHKKVKESNGNQKENIGKSQESIGK